MSVDTVKAEVHLLSVLNESGEFIFAYCDKHHFYSIYRPYGEEKLYLATCDKSLHLSVVDSIEAPAKFFEHKGIRFFKPVDEQGVITFSGLLTRPEANYNFTFNETGKFEFKETTKGYNPPHSDLGLIPGLEDIKVIHGIQRREKFYFTGIEAEPETGEHPVYGVVDLTTGKLEVIYYLYSDRGEVVPVAIAIDPHEHTVYVVGKTLAVNDNNQVIDCRPYIEKFFYRG